MKKRARILYLILIGISTTIVSISLVHQMFIQPPVVNPSSSTESQSENTSPDSDTSDSPLIEPAETLTRRDGCYTFLLVGADNSNVLADVIMVMMYDTKTQSVGLVSIPRDTLVDPTGPSHFPKINSALQHGIDSLKDVVSEMTGIPIDFYIFSNLNAFVDIVDSIGGIEFDIPVHMSYDDPEQNLHIHYEPGIKHLSGSEALEICRLRQNDDGTIAYLDYDIGRTHTQRALLITIAQKVLSHPEKIGNLIEIWHQNIDTDLSPTEILWFAEQMTSGNFNMNSIESAVLPGNGQVTFHGIKYCYELYPQDTLKIINDTINPYYQPLTLNDTYFFQSSQGG